MKYKNRYKEIYKHIYYKKLSHHYEGQEVHDLSFANWRHRRASGVTQSGPQNVRTMGKSGVNHSLRVREDEMRLK